RFCNETHRHEIIRTFLLFRVGEEILVDRRVHTSRCNIVYTDAESRVFEGKCLCQQFHAAFARSVMRIMGPGDDFMDARYVDDAAFPAGVQKMSDYFFGTNEDTAQICTDHIVEIVDLQVMARYICLDAGIVDHDIDTAEMVYCFSDQSDHFFFFSYITFHRSDSVSIE